MAIYIHEVPESREEALNPPTALTHWVIEGEFDDKLAMDLARVTAPTTYTHSLGTLYRRDIRLVEKGFRVYNFEVLYDEKELYTKRIEVDTLGGTVHIKAGIHQAVFPAGKPTHNGLIGVKGDDVEGADIVIPACRVIVHYQHPLGYLDDARVKLLTDITGWVDNAGFYTWAPYETLFLGFQGSQTTTVTSVQVDQTEEVSYHFAMSKNLTGLQIGTISGIDKKGWDVAWVKWQAAVEGGKGSNEAEYVNVVRTYPETSLKAVLGFG